MFRLSRKELQRRCATKTIQSTKEIFEALGFDDLVEPGVKLEMSTAVDEVFKCHTRIFNPEEGGEKVFVFDSHRLIKSMCRVWAKLYGTMDTSQKEMLQDKAILEQEVKKLSKGEEGSVKKLAGKLKVCRQHLRTVQDSLIEQGTTILSLNSELRLYP